MKKSSFLDNQNILAFAHRGDSEAAPENTAAAFQSAVDLGFRYLETDVHCTRDGVLIAFHDDRLDRVTNQKGCIQKLNYADVACARVENCEPIPLMEELLGDFPEARFNIDPKSDTAVRPLIEIIKRTASEDRVCVGSFSDHRLRQIRSALPQVCTSMATYEAARAKLNSLGVRLGSLSANCAQVPVRWNGVSVVDRRFIQTMKGQGIPVHVWTINDASEMHQLLDMGVDGIMTDRPSVLQAVLLERGSWN